MHEKLLRFFRIEHVECHLPHSYFSNFIFLHLMAIGPSTSSRNC